MNIRYRFRVCLSRSHWKRSWKQAATAFWSALGIAWTAIRIVTHYFPQTANAIPWWLLVLPAVAYGLRTYWPVLAVRCRLDGRDVWIEIRVDDIFNVDGAMVISTNATFETRMSGGRISRQSLQGQYTEKYYKDREQDLVRDLTASLRDSEASASTWNDHSTSGPEYEIGTVATIRPGGRTAYMVAVARLNEHGTARSSRENVVQALGRLWHYVGQKGELEPLAVPVLGTGRARVQVQPEDMIREIINSFIAACAEKRFCDELIVVISEDDYQKYRIDLQELGRYLGHLCRYTSLAREADAGEGQEAP